MINIKGFLNILLRKKKIILTTKCFYVKLKVLIFLPDMILCTIIQIICSAWCRRNFERDKSFLEDLSKGFKLKKAYAISKGDRNNTEKAYDNLVLNINKTIDDVFYKNANNEKDSEKDKIFFKKQKSCLI